MTTTTERLDRTTDIRLRILAYHVAIISELQPGDSGSTLHTVDGLSCHVERTEEGKYSIGGEITSTLTGALHAYFRQLDKVATGLHSDKD